ncbi:hypothetical protein V1508DRAFT_77830 [Lipomyces doorenjongii]|uniref:uncharacterized protein n=1 Tax=Lipomyces doorenjongii TaxID=383834 RepID=UPI0034CDBB6D
MKLTKRFMHRPLKRCSNNCKFIGQPKLFRYFWCNWYRPSVGNVGSRWEIASLCGRPGSSTIPISRTTMRLECRWRILKEDYTSHLVRPRLDLLFYIIYTGLVKSRLHLYVQVDAGRQKPSLSEDFVHLWRKCADLIDDSVISQRDQVYHADKVQGVCSCPSFIFNSRYMCISFYSSPHPDAAPIVRPPPAFSSALFQERLPLILFSGSDIGGTSSSGTTSVRSDSELINSVGDDDEPVVISSTYSEELGSFELMASENPEINETDDETSREVREIMNWATSDGSRSNPRMQRDVSSFIGNQENFVARYKRPYQEAMGSTRSADGQTMRDAARSYYFMRPQNQWHRSTYLINPDLIVCLGVALSM